MIMRLHSESLCWLLVICLSVLVAHVFAQCSLNPTLQKDDNKDDRVRQKALDLINGLPADFRNKEYKVDAKGKSFAARICPEDKVTSDHSGLSEIEKDKTTRSLGRVNETDAVNSSLGDLLVLTYTNGDDYHNACNRSERRTSIFIRPCPSQSEEGLKFLSEAVGMEEDFCYYIFELFLHRTPESEKILRFPGSPPPAPSADKKADDDHKNPVPPAPAHGEEITETPPAGHHGIGTGSLIVILVLVPTLLFVAIGALYKRFVMGAQGWEQVPFIDFWRRCGSMQADGWRYVFGRRPRGGNRYDDYTQVSTDEERQALDHAPNDDHLLPM